MKKYIIYAVVVAWIASLIVGSFMLGAVVACEKGEGKLYGLECINVEYVGVCEFQGRAYIVPEQGNPLIEAIQENQLPRSRP